MKIVMFIVITEISQQNDADLCFYKCFMMHLIYLSNGIHQRDVQNTLM